MREHPLLAHRRPALHHLSPSHKHTSPYLCHMLHVLPPTQPRPKNTTQNLRQVPQRHPCVCPARAPLPRLNPGSAALRRSSSRARQPPVFGGNPGGAVCCCWCAAVAHDWAAGPPAVVAGLPQTLLPTGPGTHRQCWVCGVVCKLGVWVCGSVLWGRGLFVVCGGVVRSCVQCWVGRCTISSTHMPHELISSEPFVCYTDAMQLNLCIYTHPCTHTHTHTPHTAHTPLHTHTHIMTG